MNLNLTTGIINGQITMIMFRLAEVDWSWSMISRYEMLIRLAGLILRELIRLAKELIRLEGLILWGLIRLAGVDQILQGLILWGWSDLWELIRLAKELILRELIRLAGVDLVGVDQTCGGWLKHGGGGGGAPVSCSFSVEKISELYM